MKRRTRVLLKITGEVLSSTDNRGFNPTIISDLIRQIGQLKETHQFGIVIGGGNFFRGNQGVVQGMTPSTAHQVGMLATMMNGLIIQDLFHHQELPAELFTAIAFPIGRSITPESLQQSLAARNTLIFAGGTGNPFFTTDTAAVLRALQIEADEIWKATKVDGIYDSDPAKNTDAKKLPHVTYDQALQMHLNIMDAPAFALAREHNVIIRVFKVFSEDALISAAQNISFGSILQK